MKRQSIISVSRPPQSAPARRHRCEICNEVFECWLCTMQYDHQMHCGLRLHQADETIPVFVCAECIESDNCAFVRVQNGTERQLYASNPRVHWWDYRTGKIVTSAQRGLGEDKTIRKARLRETFIHSVHSKKQ